MGRGLYLVLAALIFGALLLYGGNIGLMGKSTESPGFAVMRLDKSTYRIGESLTLTITNTGVETLLVGDFYRLYRLENGEWKELDLGFSFTAIGYTIPPGGNWTQVVPLVTHLSADAPGKLEPLPPGRYRIVKTVTIDRGRCGSRSDEITLSAEFEVVE